MCVCHFFGCAIALLHTFCGKIVKNCYLFVIFKSLVSNWLTVHFQNWVISSFTNILPAKNHDDLCLVHVIQTGHQMSKLVLNIKYLLLLSFLSMGEFYNLGPIQGTLQMLTDKRQTNCYFYSQMNQKIGYSNMCFQHAKYVNI